MQNVIEVSNRVMMRWKSVPWTVQHQSVRYLRKPRWVPMAKSKMYKIIDHPPQPRPEAEEMKRLMDLNKVYNKSLWVFQRHIYDDQAAKSRSDAQEISEEGDLERILMENERDNAKVRALREQQIEEEWRRVEEEIIAKRLDKEDEELKMLQQTEEKLQKEMERLKTAIREEDIDEAIEKALAVEVDYNFAIDKDGKIYQGRTNHNKGENMSTVNLEPIKSQINSSSS